MQSEIHTSLTEVSGSVHLSLGLLIAVAILAIVALSVGFWFVRRK